MTAKIKEACSIQEDAWRGFRPGFWTFHGSM